uniref:Uncharacterized protein n=1 Tax=Arundo donax TaxID=35708 RepID=A0A0A9BQU9_ARUDO
MLLGRWLFTLLTRWFTCFTMSISILISGMLDGRFTLGPLATS